MALLEYLYVDSVDLTSDLALPLFAAADFLVRPRLPRKPMPSSCCIALHTSESRPHFLPAGSGASKVGLHWADRSGSVHRQCVQCIDGIIIRAQPHTSLDVKLESDEPIDSYAAPVLLSRWLISTWPQA